MLLNPFTILLNNNGVRPNTAELVESEIFNIAATHFINVEINIFLPSVLYPMMRTFNISQ